QNTRGIQSVEFLSPEIISAQLQSVTSDFEIASAKIGALGHASIIEAVADFLDAHPISHLVVDPVMVSKHGDRLFEPAGEQKLIDRIFPHASLLTPNHAEAAALLSRSIDDTNARDAALSLSELYRTPILLTGGAG